jgi:hypothetical protein
VIGLEEKTESALKLLDDGFCEDSEFDVWVLAIKVLGQLGDAFGVGIGLEAESFGFQQRLQLLIVGNNAIVNNAKLPGRIRAGITG